MTNKLSNQPDQGSGDTVEKPEFSAILTPHRSLSRTGFIWLIAFIAFTCATSALMFFALGAWPIIIFLALDVLIIWLAFKFNYRDGRKFEEIFMWPHKLIVRQVSASGQEKRHAFNPFWARFDVERHDEHGVIAMRLREQDRELEVGSFLNPDDRESFARAFANALSDVKR